VVEKFDVINKSLASVLLKKNLSLDSTHNLTVAQVSTGFLSGGGGCWEFYFTCKSIQVFI